MTYREQVDWPELRLPPINLHSMPRQPHFNLERTHMATATIKRATVFTAPDGTTHPSAKAAAEHVQSTAVKSKIAEFVAKLDESATGVSRSDSGGLVISAERYGEPSDLEDFLFEHRSELLEILNTKVEVRQRKPRAKKGGTGGGGAPASAPAPAA